MNKSYVGEGKVSLIAGGGKIYTDVAARFCRSEKDLDELIASPESKTIIRNIVNSNHKAALEFDDFIFGIEGYSRVTEVQLVRKRHASYMIKSGRNELNGKRSYDVVLPKGIDAVNAHYRLTTLLEEDKEKINIYAKEGVDPKVFKAKLEDIMNDILFVSVKLETKDILKILESWYDNGVREGIPEEDLRYLKPQATAFKACIKMNASALRDWFMIRMCNRAQTEIRDLANKMYNICKEVAPDLFNGAGPSCKVLGYCPEGEQCKYCKGKIPTKKEALDLIHMYYS